MSVDLSVLETHPAWRRVGPLFDEWKRVLDEDVEFSLAESDWHTKDHCTRDLAYALLIGAQLGLDESALNALGAAAAYHDSRRHDDWLDVGHGARAAEYYRRECDAGKLPFDERAYLAMAYHDRDDEVGIARIEEAGLADGVTIYKAFKDADGLDRFRLGEGALDESMLRTDPAHDLVEAARRLSSAGTMPGDGAAMGDEEHA